MNMNDRERLRVEIDKYTHQVELGNGIEELMGNPTFKKVILNHFTKDYALEHVNKLCMYPKDSPEYVEIIAELDAISRFNSFLTSTINEGQCAYDSLQDAKAIPDSELQ